MKEITITADIHSSALSLVPPTKSKRPWNRYPCLNSVTILFSLSLAKQQWMPQVCGAEPASSTKRRVWWADPHGSESTPQSNPFVSAMHCALPATIVVFSPQPLITHQQYENWKMWKMRRLRNCWGVVFTAEGHLVIQKMTFMTLPQSIKLQLDWANDPVLSSALLDYS